MQELIPVVIGIGLGMGVGRRPGRRVVIMALAACVLLGTAVAWLTGELAHSIGYAIFDSGVIACTGVLVVMAHRLAWQARRGIHDTSEGVRRG
jgi:hypothetical protein